MSKIKPSNPAKINWKNIKRYIVGNFRYLIYKWFNKDGEDLKLLPKHKVEQFKWRLQIMNQDCLKNGKCVICGCQTPQLQMEDSQCDGKEYPAMMTKEVWEQYKKENSITI